MEGFAVIQYLDAEEGEYIDICIDTTGLTEEEAQQLLRREFMRALYSVARKDRVRH